MLRWEVRRPGGVREQVAWDGLQEEAVVDEGQVQAWVFDDENVALFEAVVVEWRDGRAGVGWRGGEVCCQLVEFRDEKFLLEKREDDLSVLKVDVGEAWQSVKHGAVIELGARVERWLDHEQEDSALQCLCGSEFSLSGLKKC